MSIQLKRCLLSSPRVLARVSVIDQETSYRHVVLSRAFGCRASASAIFM